MQLKNKAQREQFLENYKEWELWKEIPELELKFYRFVFPNGTTIIATEYPCEKFADYRAGHFEYKKDTDVCYSLILREGDKFRTQYSYSDNDFLYYKPAGERKSTLMEYLMKTNPEV